MTITSKSNQKVKQVRFLRDKKQRDETGLYLVEGTKPVLEAISSGQAIEEVFATAKLAHMFPGCTEVSEEVMAFMSTEQCPQGVMATVHIPETALRAPKVPNVLLLDGLQDPGNVGTIIRTANAAGYREIYLADCADPFSPKAVRASMSGIFYVQVFPGPRKEILDALKGIPLICADMKGEDVFSYRPPSRFCLCIGSEGSGLSAEVEALSQNKVSIPMVESCESLNAAVSAGICMYNLKNNMKR
ncbi:MAG: RNA methyltransferase [Clostridia bacterium]|nr:RNA methyltransferase [Clostridia bacterium]